MRHSIGHTTRNRNGLEEIQIERDMTVFEFIKAVWTNRGFNFENVMIDAFVNMGRNSSLQSNLRSGLGYWVDKDGQPVSDDQLVIIMEALLELSLSDLSYFSEMGKNKKYDLPGQ